MLKPEDWPFPRDLGAQLHTHRLSPPSRGIFASMQYFICAIEFTLLQALVVYSSLYVVGRTKFHRKLVGAIVGQALKLLFITRIYATINGFLALMVREFDGQLIRLYTRCLLYSFTGCFASMVQLLQPLF